MSVMKASHFKNHALPLAFLVCFFSQGCQAFSPDQAYEMTPVDNVEVKTVPTSKVLVTEGEGRYFQRANNLFMRLFNYIKSNDVAMTVPVEARIEKASMVFYVGGQDLKKELESRGEVQVVERPSREVASLGFRGSYSEKNFTEARDKLEEWLFQQDRYESAGKAYAVFWNGPFVPGFMKRFEVHIPVKKVEEMKPDAPEQVVKK